MTAMVSHRMTDAPVPVEEHVPTADQFIMLHGDWETFEALLAVRGERSGPRIAFLDGVVELMSPSYDHEYISSVIGHMTGVYCSAKKIAWSSARSWTLKDRLTESGLEPDDCFLFGDDPRSKLRPDLAIEVKWTSGGIKKLEIYRRLGVAEVWFWDKGVITPYVLDRDMYVAADRSRCLPDLDLALVCRFIPVLPTSAAIEQFLEAVR